ncbi:aspartate racemase [Candidatus Bathyarchaeota archaeon RBG_13_52_12]|nr:MAG: aspartate racemase [Candidatus Bathyarchaeota archaeon RBG_13_52_12]
MGPEATADLYLRIIRATNVKRDQDHPRVIIYSNSKVPDRTTAILEAGPSPLPELIRAGKRLEEAGADFIIIPCNTAHYFIDQLQKELRVPILNMIRLSAGKAEESYPKVRKAGLLASDGTVKSGLYRSAYGVAGIDIMEPSPERQTEVMKAIYQYIKAGNLIDGGLLLHGVAKDLVAAGAEMIICGCTEVSLVLKEGDLTVPILDPLQILAEAAVAEALQKEHR